MKSIAELIDISGRRGVITGGAGHLGRTFAETLAELGADVILVDLDEGLLEKTAKELSVKYGVEIDVIKCDLESETERNMLVERLNNNYQNIEVLINNAGFVGTTLLEGWVTSFENQTVDTWRRAIEVNLTSVFHLTKSLAAKISSSGAASVINIASIYGVVGPDLNLYEGTSMGNSAAYAASKGGMIQLTRWLSTVLAPAVRVNCISPGGISRGQPDVFLKRYIDKTPLRRMGIEEDFKGIVAYLSSDMSAYVTGQNFMVDGGWTAW